MKDPSRTAQDQRRRSRAELGGTNHHEVTLQQRRTDTEKTTAPKMTTTMMRDGTRVTQEHVGTAKEKKQQK